MSIPVILRRSANALLDVEETDYSSLSSPLTPQEEEMIQDIIQS